jgi:hypothetical protein
MTDTPPEVIKASDLAKLMEAVQASVALYNALEKYFSVVDDLDGGDVSTLDPEHFGLIIIAHQSLGLYLSALGLREE